MSTAFIADGTPGTDEKPSGWRLTLDNLNQGEWWGPQFGPALLIADMTDTHRYNTAHWLLRRADRIASLAVALTEPIGDESDGVFNALMGEAGRIEADPKGFVRSTELYRALVAGLPLPESWPKKGKKKRKAAAFLYADLVERAGHWSTCPRNRNLGAEVCTCERDKAEHERKKAFVSSVVGEAAAWNGDGTGTGGL